VPDETFDGKKEHIVNQRPEWKQGWAKWMQGAAFGAVAMYLLDPDRGRRRRALYQDKIHSLTVKTSDAIDVAMRDFGNRLDGIQARINRLLSRRHDAPDDQVIVARVRAKLGRIISHSHAIGVTAQQGHLILSGPILAHEKAALLDSVRTVRGVTDVEDKLQIHEQPDGVAGLQGGNERIRMRSEFLQENWTPALRGIAAAGGGALGSYGLARRTPAGMLLAGVGFILFMRGMSNMPLKRLAGIGTDRHTINLHKTIQINVSPEIVFDVWTEYENFPRFMSHVLEVRDLGEQRSHWIVKGPAGARVEWDAVLTEYQRPTVLAWHSEPGSAVAHSGSIRFDPADGGTRVTIRMSYSPPAGALGHGLAVLLGHDPKQELDDDLMRMKSFIEKGIPPHDAAKPATESSQLLH
jgi:uncharacterized membrane protein